MMETVVDREDCNGHLYCA